MNVEAVRSLVPVQDLIQPVTSTERNDVTGDRFNGRPRGGVRFMGYGFTASEPAYGPSGRAHGNRTLNGGIVDIYV